MAQYAAITRRGAVQRNRSRCTHQHRYTRTNTDTHTRFLCCAALMAFIAACRTVPQAPLVVPSIWPVSAPERQITSGFGYRQDPTTGKQRFHAGVDIAAPRKSPVVATAPGIVRYTGRDRGGYGKLVIIDHAGGYETLYGHLARITARRGKRVKRGETIGTLGETGRATGPHLHYEVRLNGTPVAPTPYLTAPQ